LEACDRTNVDEKEKYWIAKLDARNPKIGYNICVGGGGTGAGKDHPFYGTHLPAERTKYLTKLKYCIVLVIMKKQDQKFQLRKREDH
jgi:hypothetical protein